MKRLGFTLSEVLITLLIIGVLAVLTLPALVQHVQKNALESATANFYNNLVSSVDRFMLVEDIRKLSQLPGSGEELSAIERYVKLYKKPQKCTSYNSEFCFSSEYVNLANKKVQLNKYLVAPTIYNEEMTPVNGLSLYPLVQTTGVFDFEGLLALSIPGQSAELGGFDNVLVPELNPAVSILSYGYATYRLNDGVVMGIVYKGYSMDIIADVNGIEGPNVAGQDLWFFTISNNGKVYEMGENQEWETDADVNARFESCKSGTTPYGCFTHFKNNDFKFDY